jgi:hypothetical protein
MKDDANDHFEDLLLNPRPGIAAAAARDFGIDLALTVENLRLSPEARILRNDACVAAIREMRARTSRLRKPRATRDRVRLARAFAGAKEYKRMPDQKKAATRTE